MEIYRAESIKKVLEGNTYPGRGIIVGKTPDAAKAVIAYFIMGRSANSRNRVFTEENGSIFTEPFDTSKVEDPSLIIYAALKQYENKLIVTNGDQTDTIYEGFEKGLSFSDALKSRAFEPDAPNFTPRISAALTFADDDFTYEMSILKSIDAEGTDCARYTFAYPSKPGLGHFIHTYVCDGNPIPTFQGEPERIVTDDDIDKFTDDIWNALDADNRISLYVRYTDLKTGAVDASMINKNA